MKDEVKTQEQSKDVKVSQVNQINQNEKIIELLGDINGGVKELIELKKKREGSDRLGQFCHELENLVDQMKGKQRELGNLPNRHFNTPASLRNADSYQYSNWFGGNLFEPKVIIESTAKEKPNAASTIQQIMKEEEEDAELDRMLLESSLGREPEIKEEDGREYKGFTRAGTNAKVEIRAEERERAQKFYEGMENERVEVMKRRKESEEEDERFYELIKKAKSNRKQTKFKPVKRTTEQLKSEENEEKSKAKTKKFKIPFRETK